MRNISLIAAALMLAAPAHADEMPSLKGCFAETSVAGTFLAAGSRDAQAGVGGGCDTIIGNMIVGAGVRADFMDFKSGSLFGKFGVMLNPLASVYALAAWSVPDWKIKQAGQLQLGAGAELSITSLLPSTSVFVEAATSISKFGPAATKDDVIVRLGARYRF